MANFQKFWPIDKGAESFEIGPLPVNSNFSLESKTNYTTRSTMFDNYQTFANFIQILFAYKSKDITFFLC